MNDCRDFELQPLVTTPSSFFINTDCCSSFARLKSSGEKHPTLLPHCVEGVTAETTRGRLLLLAPRVAPTSLRQRRDLPALARRSAAQWPVLVDLVTPHAGRRRRGLEDCQNVQWFHEGVRCSSVVRAFAHGAMGRRIDPSWWTHEFSFQPVLHDWCNKGRGMCYHVCGMMHIKEPFLLIGKSSPCGGSGYLSRYLSGPLPYV